MSLALAVYGIGGALMGPGLREQLSPTILAVATCLIVLSTLILVTAELLRRRSERIRGINR